MFLRHHFVIILYFLHACLLARSIFAYAFLSLCHVSGKFSNTSVLMLCTSYLICSFCVQIPGSLYLKFSFKNACFSTILSMVLSIIVSRNITLTFQVACFFIIYDIASYIVIKNPIECNAVIPLFLCFLAESHLLFCVYSYTPLVFYDRVFIVKYYANKMLKFYTSFDTHITTILESVNSFANTFWLFYTSIFFCSVLSYVRK